jgi:hypothetical protein
MAPSLTREFYHFEFFAHFFFNSDLEFFQDCFYFLKQNQHSAANSIDFQQLSF